MTVADRLRSLASAATPGPWTHYSGFIWRAEDAVTGEVVRNPRSPKRGKERLVGSAMGPNRYADAAFIAALSPERVLALADLVAAAERQRDKRPGAHPDLVVALARVKEAFRE